MARDLVIIGDRILIDPDTEQSRTAGGLYLPQGLAEKEKVGTGKVSKVGPGYILPSGDSSSEPWQLSHKEPQYVPLQVKEGDIAIFLRRDAIEVEYEGRKFLIIPQAGVLAVVRDDGLGID